MTQSQSDPASPTPAPSSPALSRRRRLTSAEAGVEHTRAWTGLWVVVSGDIGIVAASVLAVWVMRNTTASSAAIVSVLTSAFTAVGTMTTAYFGIRAASNTAQSSLTTTTPLTTSSPAGGATS